MVNERKIKLEQALAISNAKGDKRFTEAVVEALEQDQARRQDPRAA